MTGRASKRLLLAVSVPAKCAPRRPKGRTADSAADRDVDTSHLLCSVLGVLGVLMASFTHAGVTEDQEPRAPEFLL